MTRKIDFFEGWSRSKFSYLGLVVGLTLKNYSSVTKGFERKVRKFFELIPTFGEVKGEKLVRGDFLFFYYFLSQIWLIYSMVNIENAVYLDKMFCVNWETRSKNFI